MLKPKNFLSNLFQNPLNQKSARQLGQLTAIALVALTCLSLITACGVKVGSDDGDDDHSAFIKGDGLPQPDIDIPSYPNQMVYRSTIPGDQAQAMSEAISSLYLNPPSRSSGDYEMLRYMMHLPDLSAQSLQPWLEARVRYVVNDGFSMDNDVRNSYDHFSYPQPNEIPKLWRVLTRSMMQAGRTYAPLKSDANGGATAPGNGGAVATANGGATAPTSEQSGTETAKTETVMSNLGAAVYLKGKTNPGASVLKQVQFEYNQLIPVTSPRVGILMIGPGLFHDFGTKIQNIALDIFRVSTLFHEARHSDGNGETLGFLHSICPESFDLAGKFACDASTNGPYTVGAKLLRTMIDNCTTCTKLSHKFLELIYLDVNSRVIFMSSDNPYETTKTPTGQSWDDTPEGQRSF